MPDDSSPAEEQWSRKLASFGKALTNSAIQAVPRVANRQLHKGWFFASLRPHSQRSWILIVQTSPKLSQPHREQPCAASSRSSQQRKPTSFV